MELRDFQAEVFRWAAAGTAWRTRRRRRRGGGGGEGSSSSEAIATGGAPVDLLGEPDGSDRPGVSEAEALLAQALQVRATSVARRPRRAPPA